MSASSTHGPAPADWLDAASTLSTIEAKSRNENFPVALSILPHRFRRHLRALYGFARLVDDVGDEAPGDRMAMLDAIDDDIDRLVGTSVPRLEVLRALVPTVRTCRLPIDPLHRLVEANRRDQTVHRYETFDDLLGYCTLSANPVGHLVLGVFGMAGPRRTALSDDVCTALQIVEHCQDVAEDAAGGRIYLPQQDMRRFGVGAGDLTGESTTPALRALLAFEVARGQALMTRGSTLLDLLRGPARIAVSGFVGGGQAALNSLAAADFAVVPRPPKVGNLRTLRACVASLGRGR